MATEAWAGSYEALILGDSESCSHLVDGAAIDAFAAAINSYNPVHMDGDWTRANTPFPDRIAHGVMTTALASRPLVQFCERYRLRTALLSSTSKYLKPVVAGDTVTTCLKLVEKMDVRQRIRFEIESTNQRGELVMVGELHEQCL